jgi:malate permease and related proteins
MDKVFLITGIFALAIALRRFGIVRERHAGALVRYVMTVSIPCLTLMTIGSLDLHRAHFDIAVIAWLVMAGGTVVSYGVGRYIGLEGKGLRTFMLVSTFPNTAFLGYPYSYSLFGGEGLSYAIIYDQIGMFPLFLTLGFFIAGGKDSLIQIFSFPPFIALVAALAINLCGYAPTGLTGKIIGWVGWTTLPLTIFIIGLKIRFSSSFDSRSIWAALSLRMLVTPLILFILLGIAGMKGTPYDVTILESAMPPALTTGILAMQYRLHEELAVSCISIGTVLSLVIFSAAMVYQQM